MNTIASVSRASDAVELSKTGHVEIDVLVLELLECLGLGIIEDLVKIFGVPPCSEPLSLVLVVAMHALLPVNHRARAA